MSDVLDDGLFEEKESGYEYKFKLRPILIWSGFILLGFMFKLLHWPGLILLVVSPAGLSAYAFSGLISLKGKSTINNILSGMGIIWLLVLVWGLIFNDGYPLNIFGVGVYVGTLLGYIILYELAKIIRKRRAKK